MSRHKRAPREHSTFRLQAKTRVPGCTRAGDGSGTGAGGNALQRPRLRPSGAGPEAGARGGAGPGAGAGPEPGAGRGWGRVGDPAIDREGRATVWCHVRTKAPKRKRILGPGAVRRLCDLLKGSRKRRRSREASWAEPEVWKPGPELRAARVYLSRGP